ncbi:MAG: hypothetical protein ACXWSD_07900, partial [Bdellovibrionota bacterium]
TVIDAGALVKQVVPLVPGIKCYWVGPKEYRSNCGGSLPKQVAFAKELGDAVSDSCTYIDSTQLGLSVATAPHHNDEAQEWAAAVAPLLK